MKKEDLNYSMQWKYMEKLFLKYKHNDPNLDETWKVFFNHLEIKEKVSSVEQEKVYDHDIEELDPDSFKEDLSLLKIVESYRKLGYTQAKLNPFFENENIGKDIRDKWKIFFELSFYGLTEEDLNKKITEDFEGFKKGSFLKTIIDHFKKIYCSRTGFEWVHIHDFKMYHWLKEAIEWKWLDTKISSEDRKRAYYKISAANQFEEFLQKKYIGQKRFSLEGTESFIPLIDRILHLAKNKNMKFMVMGMAHRGRLNSLANIYQKPYEQIFYEFQGTPNLEQQEKINDVKYHLGYTSKKEEQEYGLDLILMDNPSHLESVNPVVMGYVKAKMDEGISTNEILPILVHGDSSIAGQGIIYEQLQMMNLEAYGVGGTIHIVINNQLGYTANSFESRSTLFCSDIAKAFEIPVFHVNADDVDEVLKVASIALEYRLLFNKDVFIDLIGYRRYGHNEMDEPRFTQPDLYALIDKHKKVKDIYFEYLTEEAFFKEEELKNIDESILSNLENAYNKLQGDLQKNSFAYELNKSFQKNHQYKTRYSNEDFDKMEISKISEKNSKKILNTITSLPEGFKGIKQLTKIFEDRKKLYENGLINWAMAEFLSYGSLLLEGVRIRLVGEDSQRGTFAHRHAILHDVETHKKYSILSGLSEDKNMFQVFNSHLSEYAALAFEYGYSMHHLKHLTIWEAQFGDFVNGAQITIDQYISSGELKWGKLSNLVLFLPHGQEGQGPEHSSGRLERFLELASNYNMIIANINKPSNLYHLIRRQVLANWRKPLILMTPKSLLRHPKVISEISEIYNQDFQPILGDWNLDSKKIKKVLLCSGKIYYDLLKKKEEENLEALAIFSLEQIYPFPENSFKKLKNQYPKVNKWIWVQEEPKNMGAWPYLKLRYLESWDCIARDFSASPAVGYYSVYSDQQAEIVKKALN